jgi:hypothetical protein
MSNSKITLDDLLAGQSNVLARIARDLEDMGDNHPTAGHNSQTSGHNSAGTHSSHTSGVSAAPSLPSATTHPNDQDKASGADEA